VEAKRKSSAMAIFIQRYKNYIKEAAKVTQWPVFFVYITVKLVILQHTARNCPFHFSSSFTAMRT